MPILLIFALIAACLPIQWEPPPIDPPREAALILTGSALATALFLAFVLRTWVIRIVRRDASRRSEAARLYNRGRRILFFVNLGTAAACILGFGWGWLMQHELLIYHHGEYLLAPYAELAVPLPYFVLMVGCWLIYYKAERALHYSTRFIDRPFRPRHAYLLHNLRQFALMVFLPVGVLVTHQTLLRFAPETTRTEYFRIGILALMPLMLLCMPLVLKPLLGLKPMPPGPVRDRLESLARRLNFRCTDFLLWPTHGASANAMIAGLLPRVRYVVFTDRILEDLPPGELDSVFGHEIGHAKHGHIWFYAAFLMLSLATLAALGLFLAQLLDQAESAVWVSLREQLEGLQTWLLLAPVVVVASYLFIVFGALSRRCERQADLYGCKAVSCCDPACAGHDEHTVFPNGAKCICPTGIRIFAQALDRVHDLNGLSQQPARPRTCRDILGIIGSWLRHWQHAPVPRRIANLLILLERPGDEARFQRRLFIFKCVLMLSLAGSLFVLGQLIGWRELFDSM